jgi:hypothetical protein
LQSGRAASVLVMPFVSAVWRIYLPIFLQLIE